MKIKQIIPADMWAAYCGERHPDTARAVVCFALVEDLSGDQEIQPMCFDLTLCSIVNAYNLPGFDRLIRYEHE